jgi:hypothetical protein
LAVVLWFPKYGILAKFNALSGELAQNATSGAVGEMAIYHQLK